MKGLVTLVVAGCLGCVLLVAGLAFGIPQYKIYTQTMKGTANLRQAEMEKKILIETARAEVESAKLRAEAIEAVGEAIKAYPEYRYQEYIGAFAEALANGSIEQIIYVPTEAGIPILEAGAR